MEEEQAGPASVDDAALVRRALDGDDTAYRLLVRKYERRIYRICYRITCHGAAAEDAAQDAFIRAYFALKRFDLNRPFLPWLIRIAANRAISLAERERVYEPLPAGFAETAAGQGDPEQDASRRERSEEIRAAVESLPPKLRAVLALRVFEDLSYEEIARSLDLSIGTVMSRLSRARDRVKDRLALRSPSGNGIQPAG